MNKEEPTPPEQEDGEAVLIDSGSFKIDRSQALSKLMRFQLPDPGMYLLMLVRCAVASEATEISIRRGARDSLQIVFDGRPFTKAGLEYPYASLFDAPSPAVRRDREMAVALVSLMRLSPQKIVLRSGDGANRIRLIIHSLESDTLTDFFEPTAETILTIEQGSQPLLKKSYVEMLERCCQLTPIPVKVDGERLPQKKRTGSIEEHTFNADGIRGWIALPPVPTASSSIDVYRYGVFLSALQRSLLGGQVIGAMNDDALTANASQSGVVRNARLDKSLALLSKQVGELIQRLCAKQDDEILKASRIILGDPGLVEHWRNGIEKAVHPRPGGFFMRLSMFASALAGPGPGKAQLDTLDAILRRTLWLRGAADSLLTNLEADSEDPVKTALWNAALHMDVHGAPFSFAELERQRRHLGHVPYSRVMHPEAAPGFRALWLASTEEFDKLKRRLGGVFNDVSPVLADASRRAKTSPLAQKAEPRLSRLGLSSENLLIHTPFKAGDYHGEIALPVHRLAHGARVHVFQETGPTAFFDMQGHLKFQAAVAGIASGGRAPATLIEVLIKAAATLYRKLGEEYKPGRGGSRDEHIRRHLVDFAAWTAQGDAKRAETERWSLLAPIFRSAESIWNYERMLATFQSGATLFFARSLPQGSPVAPVFFDSQFTADHLESLFAGARTAPFSPIQDGLMLYKCLPAQCEHADGGQCLIEWDAGRYAVHLAPAPGPGGSLLESDWGAVRLFGTMRDSAGLPALAYQMFLEAFLRQTPEAALERNHPHRPLLLKALGRFFMEVKRKPRMSSDEERLAAIALAQPLLPIRGGSMTSLADLGLRLGVDAGLSPQARYIVAAGQRPTLPLNDAENALLDLFWPDPLKVFKTKAAAPSKPAPQAPAPPENAAAVKRRTPPREKPATPLSGDPVVDCVRGLLAEFYGRRGISLDGYPDPSQVDAEYLRRQVGAEEILASGLPPASQAAYLTSIIYTSVNRKAAVITDEDDAHFQRLLTAQLVKTLPGSGQ